MSGQFAPVEPRGDRGQAGWYRSVVIPETARQKLEKLPPSPGVYVFHGADGKVLYVGKARSLRSRVRSYFQPGSSDVRAFVSRLERELVDIDTYVTHTDKEAALLENQLIKSHQPKYNVKLRDDKEYLSVRLDTRNHGQDWRSSDVRSPTGRSTSVPITRQPRRGRRCDW